MCDIHVVSPRRTAPKKATGRREPAAIGQGAVIETGADGHAVLTRPGDSITVFPNSRFSVPQVDDGNEPGILQSLGKLLFKMESRESRDFKIETLENDLALHTAAAQLPKPDSAHTVAAASGRSE